MVASIGTGWLVTAGPDGLPAATLLPLIWRHDTVIAHLAKANPHWRQIGDATPALLIVTGPDAYVSPNWYASKAEHGKVVPTWNYTAVQLSGTARVHHDPEWLRAAVTDLTDVHESGLDRSWQVTDAPAAYVDGQLRGIVGVEFAVRTVHGKAKLSQNRSEADRLGVVGGLREAATDPRAAAVADLMAVGLEPS